METPGTAKGKNHVRAAVSRRTDRTSAAALRDVVVFPHMVIPLFVGRPKSIKALGNAMEASKSILLVLSPPPG